MISGAKLFRGGLLLVLLVLGMYLLLKPPKLNPSTETLQAPELGHFEASGIFWIRNNGELGFREFQGAAVARPLQTIRTPVGTQIRAEFAGGTSALLQESTLAVLDHTDKGLEFLVFEGAVQVLQQGSPAVTVIHSHNKAWSQQEIRLAEESIADTEPAPKVAQPAEDDQISDDYIHEVLGRQRRFLRSCFIKYFQRKNGQVQQGRVVLHLFIENSGKVQSTNVMNTEIEDEGYVSCLQSVVSRTRFRPFDGPPLSVEYPIELAL